MASAGQSPTILQLGKYYVPFKGGIETHLQSLCEALLPCCDVEVFAANTEPHTVREAYRSVPVTRFASAGTVLSTPVTPSMVSWMAGHNGHDLVHLHHPNPFGTLAYLAANPRGPLVVSYHSDIVRQKNLLFAYELLQQRLLRRADVILVGSPNYLKSSPTLRPHADRCRVVPYGINAARHRDDPKADIRAERLRKRFGPRLVLAVGRLVGYKGFDILLEAMAEVDGTLVLVGTGPMAQPLRSVAEESGVSDRVHFAGHVKTDCLQALYKACEVFVLPSIARNESFGIVQLEAMAAGKPVVSTRLDSGVPYVNKHGTSGLTVPPGDAPALAAAINRLLDDPHYARELGQGGLARVHDEFSEDTMIERIWKVYSELLN